MYRASDLGKAFIITVSLGIIRLHFSHQSTFQIVDMQVQLLQLIQIKQQLDRNFSSEIVEALIAVYQTIKVTILSGNCSSTIMLSKMNKYKPFKLDISGIHHSRN